MTENIDHDRLFKELISTFFLEFLELFFPEVVKYIDPDSITFLDKEIFTDVTAGEKYETDLIAKV
ncbi:MAG: flagellar assembly protein H, partial [Nostocales cyanobacterium]